MQAQAEANRINQVTPFGSMMFSGPGNNTATTTLSPNQQAILQQQEMAQQMLGQRGIDMAGQLPGAFQMPNFGPGAKIGPGNQFNLQSMLPAGTDFGQQRQAVEQAQFDRMMGLMGPQFQQQEERLRQQMANQGLPQASRAFTSELDRFETGRNRATEEAALAAVLAGGQEQSRLLGDTLATSQAGMGQAFQNRNQQIQEALTSRGVPLNEIMALLGLQQVQQPNFFGPGQVDVLGPQQQALNAQMAGFQGRNQLLGGLMGAGSALGGAHMLSQAALLASDRRVKTDIKRVGTTDSGLPIYTFRYAWNPEGPVHMGVMAQDVLAVQPDAVAELEDGTLAVDYGRL